MLATPAESADALPADGDAWAYEVKWDGVRVLADLRGGRLRLWSRAGNEVTAAYPELAVSTGGPDDVLLDGEVVVLRGGVPSFSALAERMHVRDPKRAAELARATPATFMAFDVLRLDGDDLTARPWHERRAALEWLFAAAAGGPLGRAWLVSPVYDDRDALVHATLEQGLEGVVAKRRASRYVPGGRTGDWVKLAHKRVQSCVVGGWRWETGGRDRIGALLVGLPLPDGDPAAALAYSGRVGSGLAAAMEKDLRARLEPLRRQQNPFGAAVPAVDARDAVWVEPRVVVDVRYLGRGDSGRLRQPVLRGVRADLEPADVREER